MKKTPKKKTVKKSVQLWAAVHWLGKLDRVGTEKEIKELCKRTNMSKDGKHPIHFAVPLHAACYAECDKCKGTGMVIRTYSNQPS